MTPLPCLRLGATVAAAACLLAVSVLHSPAKVIRLRNETFDPATDLSAPVSPARPGTSAAPVNGLFVVQFTVLPGTAQRAELAAQGLILLAYVPQDAFVARLENVSPDQIRALPGVTWVGEYTATHKVHRSLSTAAASNRSLDVAVVLAAGADSGDLREVLRLFSSVQQSSELPGGAVLRGKLPSLRLATLAASPAVLWVEANHPMKLSDEVSTKIVAGSVGAPGSFAYVHELGFDGSGVAVAVADSGLDSGALGDMHADISDRVDALLFYGGLTDAADEHSHGTHCAGIIAGNATLREADERGFWYGLGVAPASHLVAQRLFDGAGAYYPPPSYERLTRDATRAGAVVGSNSWGDDTQGRYDVSAYEFDQLVRDADLLRAGDQPYILEFSAGNAGPGVQTVGSPAVGKNVIATGACNSDRTDLPMPDVITFYDTGPETMADFSSRGPCEDGRIKPDVVAPGTWIASLRSVYANDDNAWWPISDNYLYQGGTSQAGPHVAGAAALFVQYWRSTHTNATPSPALVKAALINSAANMDDSVETEPAPNNDEGWGRVDLPTLLGPGRDYDYVDQSVPLTTGQVFERRVLVGSPYSPLKITLVWTDVAALPAVVPSLVNDLDLEVLAPDGQVFHGNQFLYGESEDGAPGTDTLNTVEVVQLSAPSPGEYVVRVRAARVASDAVRATALVDQDFALVTSASIGASGVGIVTLDRADYRAPDLIQVRLVDYDLAGQTNATILLGSNTETNAEPITLRAVGASGVFTGAVATVGGPGAHDGRLQVRHDDVIEAVYQDASPPGFRVARARADLRGPVIGNVVATNLYGQVLISWETDEPADGLLFYGTNSLTTVVTNRLYDLAQEVALGGLQSGRTYRFSIVATDAAGNRATNDNAGAGFTFTYTQPTNVVLLVDSFADYGFMGIILAAAPPLGGYTNALARLGLNFQVFDARSTVQPTLAQLQSYRAVIWRISDLDPPNATLTQRMTSYVNAGGSLLLCSMEGLTRFAEAGLTNFSRTVLGVTGYLEDQSVDSVAGVSGDPLGSGIAATLDYAPYEDILTLAQVTDPSDWITGYGTNASPFLRSGSATVGIRSPRPGRDQLGRVVFLSFPLDAVPLGDDIGNNRAGLLRNILNFLAPAPESSTLALDSDVYTVPGRAILEVEDLSLTGQSQTSVLLTGSHATNGVTITLGRTSRNGLFRGAASLMPTNTGAAGVLTAQHGDAIQARYTSAVSGATITTTARIETNAPAITDVESEAGYLEAAIWWLTDKETDALVQYSTSPDSFDPTNSLPTYFTAYDSQFDTYHEFMVQGLRANTTYYFRVTCRDRAGNTAMDDNGGRTYSFTTLDPIHPPWADDMEKPNPEWSTFTIPDSESQWEWGPPGGGQVANSGEFCWGSNLQGSSISQTECYLISPGILLTGGNRATLTFAHNYDFTPKSELLDIEVGAVEILTDITGQPTVLEQYFDTSDGWVTNSVDLTPYVGQVVYVLWYYSALSFDSVPRLGWLVDDVSVTMSSVAPGQVIISNNLSQAVFALAGPTNYTGSGRWVLLTNAAPGTYEVEFADVPYYITPPAQTRTLDAGGTVVFEGRYTFTDGNGNQMPDGWEMALFGVLDPMRTATTDTDGDGMTDAAEFVAGTDPRNPPPRFLVRGERLPGGDLRLSWPTFPGVSYRVVAGNNGRTWAPTTGWLVATGTNLSQTLPAPAPGSPHLFRVEVAPGATTPTLRLTASRTVGGGLRFDWPVASGRNYRLVGGGLDGRWTPVSDWQAAGTLTLRDAGAAKAAFYRLEVRP